MLPIKYIYLIFIQGTSTARKSEDSLVVPEKESELRSSPDRSTASTSVQQQNTTATSNVIARVHQLLEVKTNDSF